MKSYIYEVHDESGKLRVFYSHSEAKRFAGHDYKVVRVEEPRQVKEKFNWDDFEPALL